MKNQKLIVGMEFFAPSGKIHTIQKLGEKSILHSNIKIPYSQKYFLRLVTDGIYKIKN